MANIGFLLIFCIAGLFIGQFIGMIFAAIFYPGSISDFTQNISSGLLQPQMKTSFYVMQGMASLAAFIIAPLLFLNFVARTDAKRIFKGQVQITAALLVCVIVLAFMFFNSIFIEWNTHIKLPEFLSGFETWAMNKEAQLKSLTEFLTKFDSRFEFSLAFIIIAIIPAVGEELVFRGVLQNYLHKWIKNVHIAIWVSAIIFSLIHMQFYGLVPRILLGALFGYLYVISGSLWMAILGHFINNGFTVIMIYLYQKGAVDINLEDQATMSSTQLLLTGFICFLFLTIYYKYYQRRQSTS